MKKNLILAGVAVAFLSLPLVVSLSQGTFSAPKDPYVPEKVSTQESIPETRAVFTLPEQVIVSCVSDACKSREKGAGLAKRQAQPKTLGCKSPRELVQGSGTVRECD